MLEVLWGIMVVSWAMSGVFGVCWWYVGGTLRHVGGTLGYVGVLWFYFEECWGYYEVCQGTLG